MGFRRMSSEQNFLKLIRERYQRNELRVGVNLWAVNRPGSPFQAGRGLIKFSLRPSRYTDQFLAVVLNSPEAWHEAWAMGGLALHTHEDRDSPELWCASPEGNWREFVKVKILGVDRAKV